MTRQEAEQLLLLADRLWLVGQRRGHTLRIARAIEEWQGEHGAFDGETPPIPALDRHEGEQ